jgi:hypothetical protein
MSKRSSEVQLGHCPHPGCDVAIRLVANYRAQTLTIYHGEDELAELEPAPGHDWDSMTDGITPGGAEYAAVVRGCGAALAYGIAELHVRGAA